MTSVHIEASDNNGPGRLELTVDTPETGRGLLSWTPEDMREEEWTVELSRSEVKAFLLQTLDDLLLS
jgi:hypothetical protein